MLVLAVCASFSYIYRLHFHTVHKLLSPASYNSILPSPSARMSVKKQLETLYLAHFLAELLGDQKNDKDEEVSSEKEEVSTGKEDSELIQLALAALLEERYLEP